MNISADSKPCDFPANFCSGKLPKSSPFRDFLSDTSTHAHWVQFRNSDFRLTSVTLKRLCLRARCVTHASKANEENLFSGIGHARKPGFWPVLLDPLFISLCKRKEYASKYGAVIYYYFLTFTNFMFQFRGTTFCKLICAFTKGEIFVSSCLTVPWTPASDRHCQPCSLTKCSCHLSRRQVEE